jgi:hypothetical protein
MTCGVWIVRYARGKEGQLIPKGSIDTEGRFICKGYTEGRFR